MALPIRDGNQSPTTLSTIIVNNAHIPAHTVASLGTQAITDIATAVSGVELGPNTLNALENITVTLGQVTITGGLTDAQLRASAVTIGGTVTANVPLVNTSLATGVTLGVPVYLAGGKDGVVIDEVNYVNNILTIPSIPAGTAQIGSVTASISGTPSVTFTTAVITGSTSILNFPATQTVTFTQASVTFGVPTITGSVSVLNLPATQTVTFSQASVTFGLISGTITVGSLPAIPTGTNQIGSVTASGTVTANIGGIANSVTLPVRLNAEKYGEAPSGQDTLVVCNASGMLLVDAISNNTSVLGYDGNAFVQVKQVSGSSVTVGNTVTIANIQGTTVTTSNFTSTTPSTVLAGFNATREVLTIFNEGSGNLHISAGATCTTIGYQVRLSAGDYYEVPLNQASITHSAVFATAGTARVTQVS